MKALGKNITDWQLDQKAKYPWMGATEPYHILLSEFLLQQTRSDQALPYYEKFLARFPSIADLAQAESQEVLALWEGLGYYRRARLLHACCKSIVAEHGGKVPTTYAELLNLPGIGPYTAAAVASFAFGEEVSVVDGNVYRLFARLFALDDVVPSQVAHRKFAAIGKEMMPKGEAAVFNQAIMNLGAHICTPRNPQCDACPLQHSCHAYQENRIMDFPIKKAAAKKRLRNFHYLILRHGDALLLQQRAAGDVWEDMFEFPLLEQKTKPTKAATAKHLGTTLGNEVSVKSLKKLNRTEAVLSHQKISMHLYEVDLSSKINRGKRQRWIATKDLDQYPMPRALRQFVDKQVW